MQVRNDFERYVSSKVSLRDTIIIEHHSQPYQTYLLKSATCFRPKLHPILLDAHINSRKTIGLNIYQAALLAALKQLSYAHTIFPNDTILRTNTTQCTQLEKLFWKSVKDATVVFQKLVSINCCSAFAEEHNFRRGVGRKDIQHLTVMGYYNVLLKRQRKKGSYKRLALKMLREWTTKEQQTVVQYWSEVVKDERSEVLWQIRL